MRQLVSYDDIAPQVSSQAPLPNGDLRSPQKKRRKNNSRQGQRWEGHRPPYRDEDYEEDHKTPHRKTRRDYGLEEESRQLTHEEVWDDSALIRAWDAAVEEYEVLNGPEKKWKSEPVNKSPLWFNIPPETEVPLASSSGTSFLMPSIPAAFTSEGDVEQDDNTEPSDLENSRPVNFETFVPRHDPSLPNSKHGADGNVADDATGAWHGIVPPAPAEISHVTPNEAFERAMGAWYWAGYWTGVYHSGVNKKELQVFERHDRELQTVDEANIEQEKQEVSNDQVEESDLIPT